MEWIKENKLASFLILATIIFFAYQMKLFGNKESLLSMGRSSNPGGVSNQRPPKCHWWNYMGWGDLGDIDKCHEKT